MVNYWYIVKVRLIEENPWMTVDNTLNWGTLKCDTHGQCSRP